MLALDNDVTHFNDLNYPVEEKIRLNLERWVYAVKFDSYAYVVIPRKGFENISIPEGFNCAWGRKY